MNEAKSILTELKARGVNFEIKKGYVVFNNPTELTAKELIKLASIGNDKLILAAENLK